MGIRSFTQRRLNRAFGFDALEPQVTTLAAGYDPIAEAPDGVLETIREVTPATAKGAS